MYSVGMTGEMPVASEFAGYRLDGLVGRGGMGLVYRATRLSTGDTVALKLIRTEFGSDSSFRKRFEREARLAAQIEHPNVTRLYEAGEHEGRLFLAIGFVDGTDLEAVIAVHRSLHPRHAAGIVGQVAGALDVAHALGLVHRDVKPQNVLLEQHDHGVHAYLTDFGLSKMVSSQSGLTKTGRWVGTADYAAPEQIQAADADARTDVYALGCLLYQSLTGEVPFPHAREVSKIVAHLSSPPPLVSKAAPCCGGSNLFDAIVARAMAKAPEDRYPSAGELAADASRAADTTAPPESELQLGPVREVGSVDRDAQTTA
jgi:serine/threonine-protein kinase